MDQFTGLEKRLGKGVKVNEPLAYHTTLKIGGPARLFLTVKSEGELKKYLQLASEFGTPFLLIGGGSNLLVSDTGFAGLVIKNSIAGLKINGTKIKVLGGSSLQDFVDAANQNGLEGLEKLTDIPGTVAGAIYGNAGAYGQTISDHLVKVKLLANGRQLWLDKASCQFEYRESIFKKNKNWLILEAEFELAKGSSRKLIEESKEIVKLRRVKYKEGLKSPGSFFKNIVAADLPNSLLAKIPREKIVFGKIPAGYLLESVGAKGAKQGQVQVATYHGNLFLNQGGGKAADFYALAKKFQTKVYEKFGIKLEPEVQLVGFAKNDFT